MDSQAKRTILAMAVCLAILMGWSKLMEIWYPPPPRPTADLAADGAATQPGGDAATQPAGMADASVSPGSPGETPATGPASPAPPDLTFVAADASSGAMVTLGDDRNPTLHPDNPFTCAVTISSRGATVAFVKLAEFRNQVARRPREPDHDPYKLLTVIEDADSGRTYGSFAARHLKLVDDNATVDLERINWTVEKSTDANGEQAVLSTMIRQAGADVLRLRKIYRLDRGSPLLHVRYEIENVSLRDRRVVLTESGPVGIQKLDPMHEDRRVVTAVEDESGTIGLGPVVMRPDVHKEGDEKVLVPGNKRFVWSAVSNKYFTAIVSPAATEPTSAPTAGGPGLLGKVLARSPLGEAAIHDDLTFDAVYAPPSPIKAGGSSAIELNIYLGPKSVTRLERLTNAAALRYDLINAPDVAWCTVNSLRVALLWLLNRIYSVVGNYGIAIIVLVLIVRTILHPVTKRGQINMMKMQKGMAALKPKLEALQQQYKNDRQKLNEETMKLYRTEGVNPAGQILGCLPMVLQMPVWVALWSMLNTNVDMRHEPFFGWIRDLSAPDALVPFSGSFTIPLIGAMMGPIQAFNLLPIIMTITMYAQQKIMQKLTQPATPPPPRYDEQGRPLPDPMAQQQKMMSVMMLFFGFLFYNFPSGLNLYILTSNILGMAEQIYIKKQLKRREERGDFEPKTAGPAGPRKPTFFERLADKAEEMRKLQSQRPAAEDKKRKKARF